MLARRPHGRVVHLLDKRGTVSVCGRSSSVWITHPTLLRGLPQCRLCAKGDRLRMPT